LILKMTHLTREGKGTSKRPMIQGGVPAAGNHSPKKNPAKGIIRHLYVVAVSGKTRLQEIIKERRNGFVRVRNEH
jgi:hypothetical protein